MDRIPAYVDEMGETVFMDDLRVALRLIKVRCRMGFKSLNKHNRIKNKLAAKKAELKRKAQAEQRQDDHGQYMGMRADLDAEYVAGEPMLTSHFVPRTNRWDR